MKRLFAAVFGAPEPSWRGFVGYISWLALVAAGFGGYHRVWWLVGAGVTVAAVGLSVAVWLQGREPTGSLVELPSVGIHNLYPWTIIGPALLVAGLVAADLTLTVVGIAMAMTSGIGLWLAWRRRQRLDG